MALGCLLAFLDIWMCYRLDVQSGKVEIINSTEYNSPWKANIPLASQEILLSLWHMKIYCHVH
jgi:hypothetical protein